MVEHKTFRSCLKYNNPEKHKEHRYLIVYEKLGLKDTCLPEQEEEGIVSSTSTYGTWAMLGQSSPVCLWHLSRKCGQSQIINFCKEVRLRIPWGSDVRLGQSLISRCYSDVRFRSPSFGSDVRLGQYPIWRCCSDVRFRSHSSGRDSKSLTPLKSKDCNWERGKQNEDDVDVVAVDALCLVPIFIVCCNTLELVLYNWRHEPEKQWSSEISFNGLKL